MSLSTQFNELTSQSLNYRLMQRFYMPTHEGPRDAISVTTEASKILFSFYTLMVNVIILHLWYLVVLVVIAISSKREHLTRNMSVANVAIWNDRSPQGVIKSMFSYRSHLPLYALCWTLAAATAWAATFLMAILVSPKLIIGAAAPVNPERIYIPTTPSIESSSIYLRYSSLEVPSNLRAMDVLQTVNATTGQVISSTTFLENVNLAVETPKISRDAKGNEVYQIDYSYKISGNDFGLQRAQKLQLQVTGSCRTEYSWFVAVEDTAGGLVTDYYRLFDDTSKNVTASISDGKPPLATVYLPPTQLGGSNISFAMVISSVQRRSFTPGTDPWYHTQAVSGDPNGAAYMVGNARPPLSCWQNDEWSYGDKKASILEIESLGVLSPAMVAIFKKFLAQPRIIGLMHALGTSTLKSAATSKGIYFDAQASSVREDLKRLIIGAYIATKNTLSESTLFVQEYSDIPNLLRDQSTQQMLRGAGDFVIYGTGFAALSVTVLAVIPVLTALLIAVVYLLVENPFCRLPWDYVNALKAPVLYSSLDLDSKKVVEPDADHWDRTSTTPYHKSKKALVNVRPRVDKSRSMSWVATPTEPTEKTEKVEKAEP